MTNPSDILTQWSWPWHRINVLIGFGDSIFIASKQVTQSWQKCWLASIIFSHHQPITLYLYIYIYIIMCFLQTIKFVSMVADLYFTVCNLSACLWLPILYSHSRRVVGILDYPCLPVHSFVRPSYCLDSFVGINSSLLSFNRMISYLIWCLGMYDMSMHILQFSKQTSFLGVMSPFPIS